MYLVEENIETLSWDDIKANNAVVKMDHLNQCKFKHPTLNCLYNVYWNNNDYELSVVTFKNMDDAPFNIIKFDLSDHNMILLNYKNSTEQMLIKIVAGDTQETLEFEVLKKATATSSSIKVVHFR
jgi:hypothetical protein